MNWQRRQARNKLSELVQRARNKGPQTITRRGKRVAVILSADDYDKLAASRPSLIDHLLSGPAWDDEFADAVNRRSKTPSRDVSF
jgi:prevent-host-death family protein